MCVDCLHRVSVSSVFIFLTITIDNVDSQFSIDNAVGHSWEQWGATKERLVESMHIVQTLQRNLLEEVGFYDEEE